LIVAGCMPGNMNNVRKLCWYDLAEKGLKASGLHEQIIETLDGSVKRFAQAQDADCDAGAATTSKSDATSELPDWLRAPLKPQSPGALLRPSDAGAGGRGTRSGESLEQRARALQRGTLVHRLLHSLPEISAERRRDAALAYLERNAAGWGAAEHAARADNVLALISDQRFAAVFAEGSRAEVAIVGRLTLPGRPQALVSGQIDRLVVTKNEVLIVDFKTNHAPPKTVSEAPKAYIRQLALYRAVLGKLYPQRAVRAALLWTESTELMEISASALDAELAS
jgi:ATP-dependent helicase/nuclease subunit A